MNMASLWKLPVIYVCENNLYGEYTPCGETIAGEVLARARAFGVHAESVDGQDVQLVNATMKRLVERARRGEGPAFLECKTYRYYGHHVGDVIGEDVAEAGHPFKTLVGLVQEFGTERIIDTPISEPGYAGIGVGAAMTGMRPIVDVMFGDFITLTMDQMVNQAAKVHYMSGGKLKVPIVFRTTLGATRRSAAQHSQSLQAWVSHVPGLKVALPSSPYEAKGLMKTAIRDEGPVVIFEDKMMYRIKGPVPAEDYIIPFGVADIKRAGTDVTIVATSSMVQVALGAATMLEKIGISAEVIDPRTTAPLDKQALIYSGKKTSRAIVVDEGYERYGVTAELASVIAEGAFYHLDAPVKRIGAMDVPVPFSPVLEDLTVPSEKMVFEAAKGLCGKA